MPPSMKGSTNINEKRKLAWICAGTEIEPGWKVETLLAAEQRIMGPGANTEHWYLVVLKHG